MRHQGNTRISRNVSTLWKGSCKGPIDYPSTYSGIQIGSTLCKVFVILILNLIQQWYDAQLLDQQQGFRSGRGTTDGQQIAFKKKANVFALFVDLSAALIMSKEAGCSSQYFKELTLSNMKNYLIYLSHFIYTRQLH